MKRGFIGIIIGLTLAMNVCAQVATKLQELGMENIRTVIVNGNTVASFENNVYRGSVRGIGKAIVAGMDGMKSGRLQLVALDNGVAQLVITLPDTLIAQYKSGEISLNQVYRQMGMSCDTDVAMKALEEDRRTDNSSAWKTDIVIYPEVALENFGFDKIYTYAVNLSPAVELTMWKGALLTAQVVFPIATNKQGEYRKIRPGIMALSQEVRFPGNIIGRITVGNFTNHRIGALAEVNYRTGNGRLEVGAELGTTGYSGINEGKWYIGTNQRMTGAVKASVYVPQLNTQLAMRAERYLYGDYGVRGDCTRHFGEYAVGVYAMCVEGEINGGFHFAIPLPGKKRPARKRVRVMQPEYFDWEYSMTPWGKYFHEQMGQTYETRPDENPSSHFFQPEYIRYFLQKEVINKK